VSGEKISAGKPGEEITVNLAPAELFGVLDVSARDQDGKPLEATVIVDEEELGMTPRQYRVPLCSKILEVKTGPRKFNQALSLNQGSTLRVVATLNLDPDCDVNSYVDSKVGGYFWPVTVGVVLSLGYIWGHYELYQRWGFDANITVGLYGTAIPVFGWYWTGYKFNARQKAFKDYKPPAKCQAGLQSSRDHFPPKPASPSIKFVPVLAPSTDGITFGLSGTF